MRAKVPPSRSILSLSPNSLFLSYSYLTSQASFLCVCLSETLFCLPVCHILNNNSPTKFQQNNSAHVLIAYIQICTRSQCRKKWLFHLLTHSPIHLPTETAKLRCLTPVFTSFDGIQCKIIANFVFLSIFLLTSQSPKVFSLLCSLQNDLFWINYKGQRLLGGKHNKVWVRENEYS